MTTANANANQPDQPNAAAIREAAERLKRHCDSLDELESAQHADEMADYRDGGMTEDLWVVADAYLAALPEIEQSRREVDETPVDEAWLRSVGFDYRDPDDPYFGIIRLDAISYGTKSSLLALLGRRLPHKSYTRGDIRKLCAALGVELKGKAMTESDAQLVWCLRQPWSRMETKRRAADRIEALAADREKLLDRIDNEQDATSAALLELAEAKRENERLRAENEKWCEAFNRSAPG